MGARSSRAAPGSLVPTHRDPGGLILGLAPGPGLHVWGRDEASNRRFQGRAVLCVGYAGVPCVPGWPCAFESLSFAVGLQDSVSPSVSLLSHVSVTTSLWVCPRGLGGSVCSSVSRPPTLVVPQNLTVCMKIYLCPGEVWNIPGSISASPCPQVMWWLRVPVF